LFPFNSCNPLKSTLEKSANTSSEVSSIASADAPANKEPTPAFNNPESASKAALFPRPALNSPFAIFLPKSTSLCI
jgi:hypothetical protein